jgi:hypothetical protein
MQGDVIRRVENGGRSGIHYGWGGGSTTSYLTNNYSLKAAGIKDINNEEAQEYGLQLGAEEDGSIIGSIEYVLGEGGVDGLDGSGSNSFFQPTFDL